MKRCRTFYFSSALMIALILAFAGRGLAQNDAPVMPVPTPAPVPTPPPLSPVILTENPEVVQRFAVDPRAVREMLNRSLLKLTSATDIGTAWKRLGILPEDVVGIKITTAGGPLLSTHRPVIQTICDGLRAAGVPSSHIIIWDKDGDDMRRAGFPPTPPSDANVGISAVFPGSGYDPNTVYKSGLVGTLMWGDYEFIHHDGSNQDLFDAARAAVSDKPFGGGNGAATATAGGSPDPFNPGASLPQTSTKSYYNWLVTHTCTKIINVPTLTDNGYIGINGCLGSLALACVDNNRRFQGDPAYGDPAICEILDKDFIRRKVVVHILDALVSQYAGGPDADPQFTKAIGALYVSRDPVAIDSLVVKRLEVWRKEGHVDPIGKTADYIHNAPSYNLGTDDPSRIQLVKLP